MATCNFRTQKDFPLYTLDDIYMMYCPECECWQGVNDNTYKCPECGGTMNGEPEIDDNMTEIIWNEISTMADEKNQNFLFHNITLESGYYAGMQLYVEEKDNPENFDNDECNYYYNMCRSKAIRAYKTEQNKVRKAMKQIADANGMEELACLGVFSSGEAIYLSRAEYDKRFNNMRN